MKHFIIAFILIIMPTILFAKNSENQDSIQCTINDSIIENNIYSKEGKIVAPCDDIKIYTQNYMKDVTNLNGCLPNGVYLVCRKNKLICKILITL